MAAVDEEELESVVRPLHVEFPNSGNEVSLGGLTIRSVIFVFSD